jgi:hypothetical protein
MNIQMNELHGIDICDSGNYVTINVNVIPNQLLCN